MGEIAQNLPGGQPIVLVLAKYLDITRSNLLKLIGKNKKGFLCNIHQEKTKTNPLQHTSESKKVCFSVIVKFVEKCVNPGNKFCDKIAL